MWGQIWWERQDHKSLDGRTWLKAQLRCCLSHLLPTAQWALSGVGCEAICVLTVPCPASHLHVSRQAQGLGYMFLAALGRLAQSGGAL